MARLLAVTTSTLVIAVTTITITSGRFANAMTY